MRTSVAGGLITGEQGLPSGRCALQIQDPQLVNFSISVKTYPRRCILGRLYCKTTKVSSLKLVKVQNMFQQKWERTPNLILCLNLVILCSVKNLRLCHVSFSDYRPYFLTGGGINFIPNDDELVIVVEFPQKPTRPGYTAWQINYRTPDHDYWKYSKFPIDNNSESLNFSTLGLYEVEVVAINENDGILSHPKRKTFCECIVH